MEIFKKFENLTALIIGDVMIDSYLWGKVERVSPEAPVPIVNLQESENRLGGAANVARNVVALGAKALICSVVGADGESKRLFNLLEAENISTEAIIKSPERKTTIKHRILAGSQHLLRVDSEITTPISQKDSDLMLAQIEKLISKVDVIIFEDYDKGVLFEGNIKAIIDLARKNNIPTVVDPKKRNFLHYRNCTLFKPNLKELKEGMNLEFDVKNNSDLRNAVKKTREQLGVDSLMLTLSEYGIMIANENKTHQIAAHRREISDVSGAGDTVVSIAALCLALDLPLKIIAAISNLGGGLVCEFLGVVPIDKERLEAESLSAIEF
jgi:rfaE bifunctional protein kinase chain/domain